MFSQQDVEGEAKVGGVCLTCLLLVVLSTYNDGGAGSICLGNRVGKLKGSALCVCNASGFCGHVSALLIGSSGFSTALAASALISA